MTTPEQCYRCPLGRLQPQSTDPEKVKRCGWRAQGILVVSPEDELLDWMERELLKQISERLYGRRETNHVGS